MISYDEMKLSIKRLNEERSDVLDSFFLPMVLGLHYQISGYYGDLKKGMTYLDHAKGMIVAKPDDDSSIIFYKDQSIRDNLGYDNQDEIHVYLDNNHIIIDLPRFGITSRQSEITFDDSDEDKNNFTNLVSLIDYDIRSSNSSQSDIKYMDQLQFRDDISSVINNPNEHLRFIRQVLNDSIEGTDPDLIDFFILKVKKKFDPLDDEDLEKNIRNLIRNDLDKRKEQNNSFVIVEEKDQLERERKRKERTETNQSKNNSSLSLDIGEVFANAKKQQSKSSEENKDEKNTKTVKKIVKQRREEDLDGKSKELQNGDEKETTVRGFI